MKSESFVLEINNLPEKIKLESYHAGGQGQHGHRHGHKQHGGQHWQSNSGNTHDEEGNDSGGKYFCPMKCEGDKVYDKPGNCPVCNMKLTPVEEGHHH